jgi:hypothetical protein
MLDGYFGWNRTCVHLHQSGQWTKPLHAGKGSTRTVTVKPMALKHNADRSRPAHSFPQRLSRRSVDHLVHEGSFPPLTRWRIQGSADQRQKHRRLCGNIPMSASSSWTGADRKSFGQAGRRIIVEFPADVTHLVVLARASSPASSLQTHQSPGRFGVAGGSPTRCRGQSSSNRRSLRTTRRCAAPGSKVASTRDRGSPLPSSAWMSHRVPR